MCEASGEEWFDSLVMWFWGSRSISEDSATIMVNLNAASVGGIDCRRPGEIANEI